MYLETDIYITGGDKETGRLSIRKHVFASETVSWALRDFRQRTGAADSLLIRKALLNSTV